MRWDKLFDDLESQLEREISAEELDLGIEEERLRLGRLGLRDRLLGLVESDLGVILLDGARLRVRPVTIGRDWFSADLVAESGRRSQCIVPLSAVAGLSLSTEQVAESLRPVREEQAHPSLSARLGLTFVLRDLCRRRRALQLVLSTGEVHGTIDRVGRDHLDLAVHEAGAARRDSAVTELRIVPLAAVLLVRL